MKVTREGFWWVYDLPFGWRIGVGQMLYPYAKKPWYHLDRWFWFMRKVWEDADGWREGWQVRVLWFYAGRQRPSSLRRYYQFLNIPED